MSFKSGRLEWFHPEIKDIEDARKVILDEKEGSFIVIPCSNDRVKYKIIYKYDNLVEELPVVMDGGKFAIGMERMQFNSIDNLITYYWNKDNDKSVKTKYPLVHAVPYQDLYNQRFYFGYMTRNEAERILSFADVGAFLFRDSTNPSSSGMPILSRKISAEPSYQHIKATSSEIRYFKQGKDSIDWLSSARQSLNKLDAPLYLISPLDRHYSSIGDKLPLEITRMNHQSRELFRKALEEGKDKCYNIRIIVIGHFGAGKTTLTKRLIGDDFDINTIRSTNGVDIFIISCTIASDGSWEIEKPTTADDIHIQRMADAVKRFAPEQSETSKTKDTTDKEMQLESRKTITNIKVPHCNSREEQIQTPEATEATADKGIHLQQETTGTCKNDPNSFNTEEGYDSILFSGPNSLKESFESNEKSLQAEAGTNQNLTEATRFNETSIEYDLEQVVTKCNNFQTDSAMLSIWDFAGQAIFYITHLAFLSRRAQYILVTDVSRILNEIVDDADFSSIGGKQTKMTITDFVKFWVNIICPFAFDESNGFPKIFLAATHKDKLKFIPEVNETIISEHFQQIRQLFQGTPCIQHIYEEDFCIDCSDPADQCIKYLRRKIFDVAVQESHWGEEIPSSWMFLERRLRKEKRAGRFILSMDEIKSINQNETVKISSDEQLDLFLRFQHAIGELLFFGEEELKDIIILDPQWLIDSFKCIITAKTFVQMDNERISHLWSSLYDKAILQPELIDIVWGQHPDKSYLENKEYLILLLTKLEIIASPKVYLKDGKEKREHFYFVPCMLDEAPTGLAERIFESSNRYIRPVCFVFCHTFLPPAVFFRLLASCMQRFRIADYQNSNFVYTKVAIFKIDSRISFAVEYLNNSIRLRTLRKTSTQDAYVGLKKFIFETLTCITDFYAQGSVKKRSLFTPACQCSQSCQLYLNSKGVVVCQNRTESHEIPLDEHPCISKDTLATIYNTNDDLGDDSLDIVPSYQELGRIARRIGAENEILGIELGLKRYQIDQIKMTYSDLITDVNFEILRKWKILENPEKCSFNRLKSAMMNVNINMTDILQCQKTNTEASKALPEQFLDRIPSDEQIDQLALSVGLQYQQLAIELGLLPERVERIKMDIRKTYDRVTTILKEWRTKQSVEATFCHLCNAMAEVVMDLSVLETMSKEY